MLIALLVWAIVATTWAIVASFQFFSWIRWYEAGFRKVYRQRDCLHRNFCTFADKFFAYHILPVDLVDVLNEIEGECESMNYSGRPCKYRDLNLEQALRLGTDPNASTPE